MGDMKATMGNEMAVKIYLKALQYIKIQVYILKVELEIAFFSCKYFGCFGL